MIGKLIVHRADAHRGDRHDEAGALASSTSAPIKTTIPLHLQIMDNQNFLAGKVDTGFIERVHAGEIEAGDY